MGQTGLGDFDDGAAEDADDTGEASTGEPSSAGSGDRPDAEARAVAGDGDGTVSAVVDPEAERYPDPEGTLEVAVTQVDYTIEGRGSGEYPVVHVFGRTPENDAEHVRVHGFRPYFYTPTDSLSPGDLDDEVITGAESGYESIRGEPLTKVFGRTPRDVGQIRDRFEHYEADILFPNRLLIDKDVRSGIRVPERRAADGAIDVPHDEVQSADVACEPRVHTFDIEVDDRRGFPEDGEEPIVCLTSHDSYHDEYVVWLYEAPAGDADAPSGLPDYEFTDEAAGDPDVDVRTFAEESAMLEAYVDYVVETDADVLTGWNADDFDAPYLVDRMERLGLDYERLSRVGEVWTGGYGGPNVKGRVVFDLLYAYERTQRSELDSYRLDAVAEVELGVGKERYTGDIGDLWEQDPERLLEYNLRDVELCVEIDRKQEIIAFWNEARKFVGCKLEDATTPGDAVDMYVLHKAHGRFALPSKGQQESEDFEGGAVFDPITGVRENVTVLDLASLYPMSMVTINASPETKVDPDAYGGETYRAPNGQHFRKEPDGIMREMIDELLAEREEKKSARDDHDPGTDAYERYDRQQASVKVIMNSLYGVSGWDRFRLYDKESAAAITATGRDVIEFTETAAAERDMEVIYGDSVTGDRPVVVRDPDGAIRIIPIEALFERAVPEENVLLSVDGGVVESASVGKDRRSLRGWEALSLSDGGDAEWQPIEQVVRHETDEPAVRLQHKVGESTTTRDHSYVVEGEDGLEEAPPSAVNAPVRVPGLPVDERVETVDVYEVLDGYEREFEDARGTGGTTTRTKRVHADEERVWFDYGEDEPHSGISVQRYVDVDSEDGRALLRLLAAYVSEGSASTAETTSSRFGASIAESRREWLEGLPDDYYRLFDGATASITVSDSGGERTVEYATDDGAARTSYDDRTLKFQMMNELSAVFFREFAGQTSRGKRVPSFVFSLPEAAQGLFLDVLVEGDGSREFPRYAEDYAARNFDFETASRELAGGLSMLLTQRGKKHSLKYRDSKDTYTVRTVDEYGRGREPVLTAVDHDGYVYDLSVAENENFVDAVGGVVLHNTDSVMLSLGGDVSKQDALEASFDLEEYINSRYDDFAREELNAEFHRFEIEFEKLYRRFFQAGKKKRYAGHIVWKEGKDVDDIDITGFEYKRSDIAPITKRVQREVIEMIVTGEDLDVVKEYVHGVVEDFQAGEVDLEDVAIPGGIGKRLDNYDTDTAQVRGAKYANLLLGTNFDRGSKPKRLYLDGVHPDFWRRVESENPDLTDDPLYLEFKRDPDVICFEYADEVPEEFDVDWDRMLDKTLKGPIARVLEALGVSWEEVRSGQTQTGLGNFM